MVFVVGHLLTIGDEDHTFFTLTACSFPFFVVAVFGFLNLAAFPFAYSVFGELNRTPLPDEPPLAVVPRSSARIGKFEGRNMVTWLLYERGLGIKIGLMGSAFVPLEQVESLDLSGRFVAVLTHHSPEVRVPIVVPKKVGLVMAEHYSEKVLA
ncbi:MAG TPA: hypothetical protein PK867_10420 [Pirellulales bacterium]|nr:hypothetical protein [Pirellulales bacterium]